MKDYGPTSKVSNWIDQTKYRQSGESFYEKCIRIADATQDSYEHFEAMKDILVNQRFLPAGRVQNAMGAARETTAFNCFVSQEIKDSMGSIMDAAAKAAETMRRGGGIGFDFSRLRPYGDTIVSLDSKASGPISFMNIFDSICDTISSSGHRRGAMMAVLRIDHPDIEKFVTVKHDLSRLTRFNVSVGVTDEFMDCLKYGKKFPLGFGPKIYKTINPKNLWDLIMRSTYEYAEPGVLFLDTINKMNNLYYCEEISATNPCAEQPLPPNGACLLGSFNLVKYLQKPGENEFSGRFNGESLSRDIYQVVRAMDNVIDRTIYPLESQKEEAISKRRMGLGVTGLANAGEILGFPYGSKGFLLFEDNVLNHLKICAYDASIKLAKEKGTFPAFDKAYLSSRFIQTLPEKIVNGIKQHGIRNSHLLSIAPTGTISLVADNVSSGIEPPYSLESNRTIQTFDGPVTEHIKDHAYAKYGVKGKTADTTTVDEHLNVLAVAYKHVDSAVSKTCNVGDDVSYQDFKKIYLKAYEMGCKGVTTFRAAGSRFGVIQSVDSESENKSCSINPETGVKSCDE